MAKALMRFPSYKSARLRCHEDVWGAPPEAALDFRYFFLVYGASEGNAETISKMPIRPNDAYKGAASANSIVKQMIDDLGHTLLPSYTSQQLDRILSALSQNRHRWPACPRRGSVQASCLQAQERPAVSRSRLGCMGDVNTLPRSRVASCFASLRPIPAPRAA